MSDKKLMSVKKPYFISIYFIISAASFQFFPYNSIPSLLGGRRTEGDLRPRMLTWGERSADGPGCPTNRST